MKNTITIICAFLILQKVYCQPAVNITPYATGIVGNISDIENTGDGRLFVTTQLGYIRIVKAGGNLLANPFLNISSKVTPTDSAHAGEQGLLGLAFSPNYATDGYFYINYTNKTGIGNSVIARYHVSSNADSADANSEQILLTIPQPHTNHNGGCLKFGGDGYLYCGFGDGGGEGDPNNLAQNMDTLFGKILRIDVSGGGAYTVPADNPFVGQSGIRPEIWAYGFRNPWRFSFDRVTHGLWIADVGEDNWEEIDYQAAASTGGQNYGWKCYEGDYIYDTTGCHSSYVSPVYNYSHSATGGCSITGGYIYRGAAFPDLYGYYLYTDYCNGIIYTLSPGSYASNIAGTFSGKGFTTFGEDSAGELYIGSRKNRAIYKITSTVSSIQSYNPDILSQSIYPEPNAGNFVYRVNFNEPTVAEVDIIDISGRVVYSLNKTFVEGDNMLPIQLNNPTAGFYLVQLKTPGGTAYQKFIVQ